MTSTYRTTADRLTVGDVVRETYASGTDAEFTEHLEVTSVERDGDMVHLSYKSIWNDFQDTGDGTTAKIGRTVIASEDYYREVTVVA